MPETPGPGTPAARPHLTGTVVHGAGRGHGLGFPTANIAAGPDSPVPPAAVYSGWVVRHRTGAVHPATISVGSNPTFCDTAEVHVEAYCHDLAEDVYGEPVTVWFAERLRDTVKFPSPDALVRAVREDVRRSEAVLASDHGRRVRDDALAAHRSTITAP
ncbi:riboflavin kinase [Kitasatospora sp. NPDC008115]|uniref:riboflavin kinase n=1 Tax=Kitasatospora sp. NPDC008115 TaxID=3364022 RepID=UPI0036ECB7F4